MRMGMMRHHVDVVRLLYALRSSRRGVVDKTYGSMAIDTKLKTEGSSCHSEGQRAVYLHYMKNLGSAASSDALPLLPARSWK